MLRTTDRGKRWEEIGLPTMTSLYAVTFDAEGRNGWVVGGGGRIFRTSIPDALPVVARFEIHAREGRIEAPDRG
jgi:photosystem II stability/assembly factor-like uncharacterized protein